jgi:cell envelope opacity-associated protein A
MKVEELQSKLDFEEKERLKKENEELKKQLQEKKPSVVNITNNNYIQMNTLYMDYPQNPMTTQLLDSAKRMDLSLINTPDDLNAFVGHLQDLNGNEIEKYLSGNDLRAKSQALSFLAHAVKVVRERIQEERPQSVEVIEVAEEFEKDCLNDKQLIRI